MVTCPPCFWPRHDETEHRGRDGVEQKGPHHGRWEAEKETERDPGQDMPHKDPPPATCVLQPGPLPNNPSVSGLIH
jgi:hypothetical protein